MALLALLWLALPASAAEEGTLLGQVFDGETGIAVPGVTVTLIYPAPPDGSPPRQEVRESGSDGVFEFGAVPKGRYDLTFGKTGYRASRITAFEVVPGQENRADFPLPPLAEAAQAAPSTDIEEFVVTGSTVAMESLELRVASDELLNVLSAEELSKFAATDVGDALKRVAGVNVVEGQFAVIRGLEDRYSSTLYNSAPIPSPDPDRQSVQLDLFPAEIVNDLVVSKTFAPDLPGNSGAGSIDIVTHDYPDEFDLVVNAAGGFNENAVFDRFLKFEDGSPVGKDYSGVGPLNSEFGAFAGGRTVLAQREVRYKALFNWERTYVTAEGFQQGREPLLFWSGDPATKPTFVVRAQSGGLSLGKLGLSAGRFDLTESEEATQLTAYGGFGFDLDQGGNHRLDASIFYTKKDEDTVQLLENGFLPNFDYGVLAAKDANGDEINSGFDFAGFATPNSWIARKVRTNRDEPPSRGPLWFTNFSQSASFKRDRDLFVSQLNGDDWIAQVPGLRVSWAGNYARTTQDETALGTKYFFEPSNDQVPLPTTFPAPVSALGPGVYATRPDVVSSANQIEEKQGFGRLDGVYERNLSEPVHVELRTGGWYEYAHRDVASSFLESPTVNTGACNLSPNCDGSLSQFSILGDTPQEMGRAILGELNRVADGTLSGLRDTTNESNRTVWAWNLGSKATFWDRVDLLGGFRLENLFIESLNEPFTGQVRFNVADTFPTRYLLWDRLDNPTRGEVLRPPAAGTIFNDQILGLSVPLNLATTACDPTGGPHRGCVDVFSQGDLDQFVNGTIDERHWLPSAAFAWRPLAGMSARAAYSQTVARPSFREMGFYVSVDPGTDDRIVGNPQLHTSFVTSYDTRVEYVWGELGEIASFSFFYKTIETPIESIIVRDPTNFDLSSTALYRTFFNNPNTATLWGIEVEGRKNLGFLGPDLAEFFTLGGNFTWIDANVDRTEPELIRSQAVFGTLAGASEEFSHLAGSRRLFGQPKWIANGDLSFEQPDWGTKVTLAFFAISDVLDAAGSATIGPDGTVISFTPDRYVDSFYQLDLVASQTWDVPFLRGDVTLKLSAKNLTDSTRRIVYDPSQTLPEIPERSYKVGRTYKLSLTYRF